MGKNTILIIASLVVTLLFSFQALAQTDAGEPPVPFPSETSTITTTDDLVVTEETTVETVALTVTPTTQEFVDDAETGSGLLILAGLSIIAGLGLFSIKKYFDSKKFSL